MKTSIANPRKALNKAFLKVKPNRTEIERFKANLIQLLNRIDDNESEEFHKNLAIDFLRKTYYDPNYFINTKGKNDLVVHNSDDAKSSVGVIVEAKKPTNKSEMISIKNLNTKALHELILYYLRERITHRNLELKHLIISNINEWFIFDATTFERLFAQNRKLVKQFEDFECGRLADTKTEFFYQQIAEPLISSNKSEIEFTYFNLQDYRALLLSGKKSDDIKLIPLFKVLSPEHLLKLPFTNDSNSLDQRFYSELLHIIGLNEIKEGSKNLIKRNNEGERHSGTIIEDTIIQLDSLDKLSRLTRLREFGNSPQEQLFNVALELAITWINRILFLKLLEGQLITYHRGDKSFAFLNLEKIKNYDDLNTLFFQVLAKKYDERNADVIKIFESIPYLNSSLFEPTNIEQETLFISNLRDDKFIPIFSSSVLKDQKGKRRTGELHSVEYLFEFLNAYDFSNEGSEEIQEDNKSLINASVLGLIFEKVNGYKDGSFFTPGFITMYMCRQTIRKAIVEKFNSKKGWECKTIDELYDMIEPNKSARNEANAIVNDLKICDPAVGSGHFLVSALNEVISVKNDLKILQDREGKRLKEYQVEVVNDELIVTDEEGELCEYNRNNKESQRIQEALFHEKQTIIENCLFGVDINPNSVKICRLRLWIELLKNAYYKNTKELETLPNIDINIKRGNSLISRFKIDADLKPALSKNKVSIDSYREAVDTYRNAKDKEEKRQMARLISDIKTDFRSEISSNDPKVIRHRKLSNELFQLSNQGRLFEMSKKEQRAWNANIKKLAARVDKLHAEIDEIKANKIFENAFEWRFEFPEVLNPDGEFVGFDALIGNPPYLLLQNLSKAEAHYLKSNFRTATFKGDTFAVFIELANRLINDDGIINVIVPYTWTSIKQHVELRRLILPNIDYIIDLPQKVFDNADLDTTIIQIARQNTSDRFLIGKAVNDQIHTYKAGSKEFCKQNELCHINLNISDDDTAILKKMKSIAFPLEQEFEVSQGYIPYRRSDLVKKFGEAKGNKIVDERLWHSNKKLSPEFKQEIQGRDLSRFKFSESFQYVKYGKHLAGYVNPRFFASPRVLIMEVTRGVRYKLTSTYVEKELYNTPSIINIIHPTNDSTELLYLTAILNSRLFTWYHLKTHSKAQAKTSIPKILVGEVRNLPLPITTPEIKKKLSQLTIKAMTSSREDLDRVSLDIDKLLYELYEFTNEEVRIIENVN